MGDGVFAFMYTGFLLPCPPGFLFSHYCLLLCILCRYHSTFLLFSVLGFTSLSGTFHFEFFNNSRDMLVILGLSLAMLFDNSSNVHCHVYVYLC